MNSCERRRFHVRDDVYGAARARWEMRPALPLDLANPSIDTVCPGLAAKN